MNGEEPVRPDEPLLRRIPPVRYRAGLPVPIDRLAFRPTQDDTDGISMYRAEVVTAAQVANSGRQAGRYYVAQLFAHQLFALGLTAVPTPGDLPGHVSIPELRYPILDEQKERAHELQRELAVLASACLVFLPGG